MKKNRDIKSLADLQLEVNRLKVDSLTKEVNLKDDVRNFVKGFSPMSLIKKFVSPQGLLKLDEKSHLSGSILSVVLPFILNKTVFRGSGFITKAVAALVSGKLGKSVDLDSLTGIFNKAKSLFSGIKQKKKEVTFPDYGIPPDSETF